MIKDERLNQLAKEKATIWYLDEKEIVPVKINDDYVSMCDWNDELFESEVDALKARVAKQDEFIKDLQHEQIAEMKEHEEFCKKTASIIDNLKFERDVIIREKTVILDEFENYISQVKEATRNLIAFGKVDLNDILEKPFAKLREESMK